MFKKTIPLPISLILVILSAVLAYFISAKINAAREESNSVDTNLATCNNYSIRLSGYEYIRPLLFGEKLCESPSLMPVKAQLEDMINNYKISGTLNSASVYLRELNQGEWMSIDEKEKYNPGSLLKVPELITFFKMNEKTPGLLERKVAYNKPLNYAKKAFFVSKSIELGKTYTVRELLYYMIAYSDNNATMLLNEMMDLNVFKKVFTDIGLPDPDMSSTDIPITAREYSFFMRVLYNASYLNIEDSEYCTELLTHSDFVQGLVSGLPAGTKVAHKFGEAGDVSNAHFGETAIIYINNSPYLLTVMTKGKDNKALPGVISNISRKVYDMIQSI